MSVAVLAGTDVCGQSLQIVDNPDLGEFVDIVAFSEPLRLVEDGEVSLDKTFEGNFVFLPGIIVVGQNGGANFGAGSITNLEALNEPIPSQGAFQGGQAALVFWDDIDDKESDAFFQRLIDDPVLGDRLIIQWDQYNFDGAGGTLKFQVQVLPNFDPTGIYAQYVYEIEGSSGGAGASATIGYQDGSAGFGDVQFSFNKPDAVMDGTVLSLMIPDPADLDRDGAITVRDLLLLLAFWGPCADCQACGADLDGDCMVGVGDLLILLEGWG